MTEKPPKRTRQETIDLLREMLEKAKRGEIRRAVWRYQSKDGQWHDRTYGFETDEERDAAVAAMHRSMGHLH